jgi:anti-sigma regulatory factor (Ser/Thr protein kinase)
VEVTESTRLVIEEQSQTAEARRIASGMALDVGLDENDAQRVSIAVTEACTNLLKHGGGGEIFLSVTQGSSPEFEVLALDRGPGITNLADCLRDGYSTGGSPGQGLGAIRRLSSVSDLFSIPGQGTALLARWSKNKSAHMSGVDPTGKLRIGAVNACKPGQEVCGDSWGVEQNENNTVVLVADGLGHGPEARDASMEAVRMMRLNPQLGPQEMLERCHLALRSTRGAAVSVARIDRDRNKVTFAGVGNVAAQIYSGAKLVQHLVSVNGTAGHHSHKLREFSYPWPSDGMMVLHSDGLATGTNAETRQGLAMRDPALIAGVLYRDFTRGNDDSTVVVAKAA